RPLSYNTTGNPGMATGGMGDVLTGVCAGLLGQGLSLYDAARVGAWVCGRAAEIAIFGNAQSEQSLLPRDVLDHLGDAFKELWGVCLSSECFRSSQKRPTISRLEISHEKDPVNVETESTEEYKAPSEETAWSREKKAFGPLAVVGVVIAKFFAKLKFILLPLLKFLPILLKSGGTMLLMVWIYTQIWGWQFALGFVLLLFVHESGHLVVAKKFGLKVGAPVFIPFMGAFIALKEAPRNAWIEACVGIGGPMLGSFGALICNVLGELFQAPLFIALAWFGYFLNLFNLTPVGMLDGGRIVTALSRWLWLPGFAVLLWFGWKYPNFIIWLIVL